MIRYGGGKTKELVGNAEMRTETCLMDREKAMVKEVGVHATDEDTFKNFTKDGG